MHTNFAEIDSLANVALDRAHSEPKVPPVYKTLAGFSIFDTPMHEKNIERHRGKIDTYRTERTALIQELEQHGVTPLAVIPKRIWNRICRESGLFRFAPDMYGNVCVNNDDAKYFWGAATMLSVILWSFPVIGTIYGMTQIGHWNNWVLSNWSIAVLLVAQLIGGLIMATGLDGKPYAWANKWLAKGLTKLFYDWGSHAWVMSRLFPNLKAPRHTDSYAKLILPNLPAEIAAVLERASKTSHCLRVAVVPEAFRLQQQPSELFTKIYDKNAEYRVERVREFWANFSLDPIVYIQRGDTVAIIAQFGDFPIEREAVEKAMDHEDCLL